ADHAQVGTAQGNRTPALTEPGDKRLPLGRSHTQGQQHQGRSRPTYAVGDTSHLALTSGQRRRPDSIDLVHAGQEVHHGGTNVFSTVSSYIGINSRADVVAEDYERGLLEVSHNLSHDLIRLALVARQRQEAGCKGAQCAGVHALWANQGQGGDAVGVSGSQPPPVSYTTGREVSARDPQVLEKLQEAFFYRKFYCCAHIDSLSFGQSTTETWASIGV